MEKMGTEKRWDENLSSELIQTEKKKNIRTRKSLHAYFTSFHNKLSSFSLATF